VKVTSPRLHEFVSHQRKGTRVLVMGRLDIGHYQGKDGESRTSFDVWADDVQALSMRGPLSESDADGGEGEQAEPVGAGVSSLVGSGAGAARANAKATVSGSSDELEDLPF
jgi:single-stranded DNA-binding protein